MGKKRSTPLGFLPGDADIGTHCMFVYPKRDEVYLDRLAGYLKAGLDSGEMCVCVLPQVPESLFDRMRAIGADAAPAIETGQLSVHDSREVYLNWGTFDMGRVLDFWKANIEKANTRWNGIRIFGEPDGTALNRTLRLKLLEYESNVNLSFSKISIALCGYQSSTTPRTLLVQMNHVHPFVASIRSMQRNHQYIEPRRFLSTFYRFQRISRIYPALPMKANECRRHFEEIAARTPMTMVEMESMKLAVGEAFANALEHGCSDLPAHLRHIHVGFLPQPTEFIVEVRDHGNGFIPPSDDEPAPDPEQPRCRGLHLMRNLVHGVDIDRRRDDTVVTLRLEYSFPFNN